MRPGGGFLIVFGFGNVNLASRSTPNPPIPGSGSTSNVRWSAMRFRLNWINIPIIPQFSFGKRYITI